MYNLGDTHMIFSQPCLIMSIENNKIDWTIFATPGDQYTKEEIFTYCDSKPAGFFVYPINNNATLSHTMDYINDVLKIHEPLNIPGMFTLT